MWEPRFKSFPYEYERKIGDTQWIGVFDLPVKLDEIKFKALQDKHLELAQAKQHMDRKDYKKLVLKIPFVQSDIDTIDATKKLIKEKFGKVKVIRTGASYVGYSMVFMIEDIPYDDYTDEQKELMEKHGDGIQAKVREVLS